MTGGSDCGSYASGEVFTTKGSTATCALSQVLVTASCICAQEQCSFEAAMKRDFWYLLGIMNIPLVRIAFRWPIWRLGTSRITCAMVDNWGCHFQMTCRYVVGMYGDRNHSSEPGKKYGNDTWKVKNQFQEHGQRLLAGKTNTMLSGR